MKTQSNQRKKEIFKKKKRKKESPSYILGGNEQHELLASSLTLDPLTTLKIALSVWLGTTEMTHVVFFFSFSSSNNFGLGA